MAAPFPRLPHPNLGGRSLLRKALIRPPKLLLQPERYATVALNLVYKFLNIIIDKKLKR